MKEYLDRYMLRDLTQTATFTHVQDMSPEEKLNLKKKENKLKKKKSLWFKIWTS